jgi:hypothetical protein
VAGRAYQDAREPKSLSKMRVGSTTHTHWESAVRPVPATTKCQVPFSSVAGAEDSEPVATKRAPKVPGLSSFQFCFFFNAPNGFSQVQRR